jgi:hypothetical protein
VAGEGEYALRYTSVAFGAATIALAYALGRRLFGWVGGLIAAGLTAASPFLWYYSTEARMFAPAAFLALLALWFGHRGGWLGLAVTVAVALYTYYYSLFVLAPIGLWALWRGQARAFALATGGAAGLYLPWLPVLLGRTQAWESPWTPPTSPAQVLRWTWPTLLTGIPDVSVWSVEWRAAALAAVGIAVGVLAAAGAVRRRDGVVYAAAAGLLPLALIAAVALFRPIYHPRYAAPATPGLYLALAGALVLGGRWLLPVRATLAIALVALFGWGLSRYFDGDGMTRDNYRDAVAWVNAAQARCRTPRCRGAATARRRRWDSSPSSRAGMAASGTSPTRCARPIRRGSSRRSSTATPVSSSAAGSGRSRSRCTSCQTTPRSRRCHATRSAGCASATRSSSSRSASTASPTRAAGRPH